MSEYHYYEFQAIDRPLTDDEQKTLHRYSGRAMINAARFVNSYSYGDFRGDESEWMAKYFDAFLYIANCGAHRLMPRLPGSLLPLESVWRKKFTLMKYCWMSAVPERPHWSAGLS